MKYQVYTFFWETTIWDAPKKYIFSTLVLLVLGTPSFLFGQVLKLKSTSYSSKIKGEYGWSNWEDWTETSVLITIDEKKERIVIYSSEKQVYDIAEDEGAAILTLKPITSEP